MKKYIHLLIKIYLLFTILIPLKLGILYLNTIIGILIIILGIIYLFNKYKGNKKDIPKWIKTLNILTVFYSIICTIQMFIVTDSVKFNIVKIVLVLISSIIVNFYIFEKDKIEEILRFSTILFIISLIGAVSSYMMGIQKIILEIPIEIVNLEESIRKFSEARLEWVLHHKSEMAIYSLFALMLFINYISNKYIKIVLVGLSIMTIALTKSKTSLILTILMLFILFTINSVNNIKNIMIKISSVFFGASGILISLIICGNNIREILISAIEGRDIHTLGYRTVIWGSAITTIKKNFMGTGANFTASIIPNPYYEYQTYSNAHNFILQEILESGVLGGIIYLIIIILFLIMLFKYNKTVFIILFTAIVASQMDLAIYNLNKIIMFSIIPLCILNKYLIRQKAEIKREDSISNFGT